MCGIIGIISKKEFPSEEAFLTLKRLEYRGYDSFGYFDKEFLIKKTGHIQIPKISRGTRIAILHTRWSTHGGVTEANAHPHQSCDKRITIVHNGIIENYLSLKEDLISKGHRFVSETDSEVIAHYFEEKLKGKSMKESCVDFMKDIKGTFAVLLIKQDEDKLYALKRDSPLVLGLCTDRSILASDIHAFSDKTDKAVFFEDNEFAVITDSGYEFFNSNGKEIKKEIKTFLWKEEKAAGADFRHFMIKEIKEQPVAAGRLLNSLNTTQKRQADEVASLIKQAKRVVFLACGTSYHACLVGESLFNRLGIEALATNAADFNPHLIKENTLVIAITQSGETMDVIKSIKEIKQKNVKLASLVNVPYSTIQRISDYSLEISAGQEICVASTKTFTNQVLTLMYLARSLGYSAELNEIPEKIGGTIKDNEDKIKKLANEIYTKTDAYILGKGVLFPIAKEIALKIKEISYIHAEGMQAGELKHGTIALIENGTPVISLIPNNDPNLISNAKEVESRGAFTIAITNAKTDFKPKAEFRVPNGDEFEFALYSNIIGQLLTYYVALKLKRPIDKPKNLAKSVTVL